MFYVVSAIFQPYNDCDYIWCHLNFIVFIIYLKIFTEYFSCIQIRFQGVQFLLPICLIVNLTVYLLTEKAHILSNFSSSTKYIGMHFFFCLFLFQSFKKGYIRILLIDIHNIWLDIRLIEHGLCRINKYMNNPTSLQMLLISLIDEKIEITK